MTERINEKLVKKAITMKNFKMQRPKFYAKEVYQALRCFIDEILEERGDKFIGNEQNIKVIGQIALWIANDQRFKGSLKKGLMIRGNVGTGKTVIAKAINRAIIEILRKYPFFINAYDLQTIYTRHNEEEIEAGKNRIFAIIDDMGVEATEVRYYGNVIEPFNDMYDSRYRNNKITIITTNLLPREITERYGERIRDRLREDTNDLILDYKSFRK